MLSALAGLLVGCAPAHSVVTENVAYQNANPEPIPSPQDKPLFDCAQKYSPVNGVRTAYESWQICKKFANANQLAQVNESALPGAPGKASDDLDMIERATGTTAADNEERQKDKIVAAAQVMEAAHPYRLNGLTAAATIATW